MANSTRITPSSDTRVTPDGDTRVVAGGVAVAAFTTVVAMTMALVRRLRKK